MDNQSALKSLAMLQGKGAYAPRGSQGAIDVEEADCVFDGTSLEGRVDGCCFGHDRDLCGSNRYYNNCVRQLHFATSCGTRQRMASRGRRAAINYVESSER